MMKSARETAKIRALPRVHVQRESVNAKNLSQPMVMLTLTLTAKNQAVNAQKDPVATDATFCPLSIGVQKKHIHLNIVVAPDIAGLIHNDEACSDIVQEFHRTVPMIFFGPVIGKQ